MLYLVLGIACVIGVVLLFSSNSKKVEKPVEEVKSVEESPIVEVVQKKKVTRKPSTKTKTTKTAKKKTTKK